MFIFYHSLLITLLQVLTVKSLEKIPSYNQLEDNQLQSTNLEILKGEKQTQLVSILNISSYISRCLQILLGFVNDPFTGIGNQVVTKTAKLQPRRKQIVPINQSGNLEIGAGDTVSKYSENSESIQQVVGSENQFSSQIQSVVSNEVMNTVTVKGTNGHFSLNFHV